MSYRKVDRRTPEARARHVVHSAVREGRLVRQPCEVCGETEKTEAHHKDYSKPYDIQWLCCKHHHEAHSENLVGRRFFALVVLNKVEFDVKRGGGQRWLCRCDCGEQTVRATSALKNSRGAKFLGCHSCSRKYVAAVTRARNARAA
jgi:hypothetical protein